MVVEAHVDAVILGARSTTMWLRIPVEDGSVVETAVDWCPLDTVVGMRGLFPEQWLKRIARNEDMVTPVNGSELVEILEGGFVICPGCQCEGALSHTMKFVVKVPDLSLIGCPLVGPDEICWLAERVS